MNDRLAGPLRALAALPDGSLYLVHKQAVGDYCRRLRQDAGREPRKAIRFVSPPQVERLQGLPTATRWDVDHAFFDLTGREGGRAYEVMRILFPQA